MGSESEGQALPCPSLAVLLLPFQKCPPKVEVTAPGRGLDTCSTFLGLPDGADELQKGAGKKSVPGEAPDVGEG